jgi:Winged helix-turn helix
MYLELSKSGGGVLIVSSIKQALEARLGRAVALSSVYNLLHRHGWRKLAPDTRHPKAEFASQEQWKKNSPKRWRRASRKSKGKGRFG